MLRELVAQCRSCRRFDEGEAVSLETLRELADLARLAPSAADGTFNAQHSTSNFQPNGNTTLMR